MCPTLCNPMDCSPPSSSVHGILQARILEWVAISSSRGYSQPRDRTRSCLAGGFFTTESPEKIKINYTSIKINMACGLVSESCPTFLTPWTLVCQAPLSMGFSRQQYWNGLPFPSPGNLPNPGIEPGSSALQADSSPTELSKKSKNKYIR